MLRSVFIFILIFQFNPTRAEMFEQCLESSGSSLKELQKLGQFLEQDSLTKCLGVQKRGNQSDFWAQEMIGTDLVQQRIKEKNLKLNTIRIGVVDSLWDLPEIKSDYSFGTEKNNLILESNDTHHGSKTVNTLSSKNSNGIASSAHPLLFQLHQMPDVKKHPVDFFNISATSDTLKLEQTIGNEKDWQTLLQHTPVFMSSGNASRTLPNHGSQATSSNLVLVGAVEPSGLVTSYSTVSDSVAVLSPAGTPFYSTEIRIANDQLYSGTSAAAPVVSGVFSDFFGLAGKINGPEIKKLLQATSQPSPIKLLPDQKNKIGTGIINHYKMFRVAEKLAANNKWPNDRNLLNQPSLYDFTSEAAELEKAAVHLLESNLCENKKNGFKKLREAFLLNPSDKSRFLLSYLYRQMNISDTANFYWNDSQDKLLGSFIKDSIEAYKLNRFGSAREEYLRFMPDSYNEVLKKVFPRDQESVRYPSRIIVRAEEITVSNTNSFLAILDEHADAEGSVLKHNVALDKEATKKEYASMVTTSACFKICLQNKSCLKNNEILDIKSGLGDNCQKALKEFALKKAYTTMPYEFKSMSFSILKQLGSKD